MIKGSTRFSTIILPFIIILPHFTTMDRYTSSTPVETRQLLTAVPVFFGDSNLSHNQRRSPTFFSYLHRGNFASIPPFATWVYKYYCETRPSYKLTPRANRSRRVFPRSPVTLHHTFDFSPKIPKDKHKKTQGFLSKLKYSVGRGGASSGSFFLNHGTSYRRNSFSKAFPPWEHYPRRTILNRARVYTTGSPGNNSKARSWTTRRAAPNKHLC